MPFTPAHSAIVLPFIRINPKYLSATGLIIGSITPDFEYFFKMSVSGVHGHTFPGLFYFDLPVATVLSLVFHLVVKRNLINNLPAFFQRRFYNILRFDFLNYLKGNYVAFGVSVALGTLSHIFWDGFTHSNGYFVRELPFYDGAFIKFIDGVRYPLWYALQHISTFAGLLILIIYVALMRPVSSETMTPSIKYWLIVLLVVAVVIFVRFNFEPLKADIGNFVVSFISANCLAVIFAGLIPLRNKKHG
jgi:hypothetical protein